MLAAGARLILNRLAYIPAACSLTLLPGGPTTMAGRDGLVSGSGVERGPASFRPALSKETFVLILLFSSIALPLSSTTDANLCGFGKDSFSDVPLVGAPHLTTRSSERQLAVAASK